MIVLKREEMYRCDANTIAKAGIPGKELMENAGRNSAIYIRENILESGRVIIFCGAGNNGGDGFVIARYLKEWGYLVTVMLTGKETRMTPETESNMRRCQLLNIEVKTLLSLTDWQKSGISLSSIDLVIDAILGVGFRGKLRGWLAELIEIINNQSKLIVAIDIASGTDADNGMASGSIRADFTLTMAALKYGSLLGEGAVCAGKTIVMDIGMPDKIIQEEAPKGRLATSRDIVFPLRKKHFHKGNYGRIAIIAGSKGYSGAAIMAARAALRAGAGLITLFHPAGMESIFETQLLEVMTRTLPDDVEKLWQQLERFDAILIGPGTGMETSITSILEMLIKRWQKPLVIDADGLNTLAKHPDWLSIAHNSNVLLTPHIGEFARLTGNSVQHIMENPIAILESFCNQYDIEVFLKSSTSIFSDGKVNFLEISGNDGLATGGSGDVLAGIIVSFIGQGLILMQAALAASNLMGITAEKLAKQRSTASIIPSDIIENLFRF